MNISIFLSKSLGIYLIFISIAYFINEKKFRPLIINMMNDPALLLVTGFIPLIIGILLIVSHNIWVEDWRVIITIVGWMAFLKGVNIILFPEFLINFSKKWIQHKVAYHTTFIFTFLMGSILMYYGYIQN